MPIAVLPKRPQDRAVHIKSVSNSVVAALVGGALKRGSLTGVELTLGEIAPELIPSGFLTANGITLV